MKHPGLYKRRDVIGKSIRRYLIDSFDFEAALQKAVRPEVKKAGFAVADFHRITIVKRIGCKQRVVCFVLDKNANVLLTASQQNAYR